MGRCCASAIPTNRCTRAARPKPASRCSCRRCRSAKCARRSGRSSTRLDHGRLLQRGERADRRAPAWSAASVLARATRPGGRTRSRIATSSSRWRCASAPRSRRRNAGTRPGRCGARLANDLAEWVGHGDFDRAARRGSWTRSPTANPLLSSNLDMSVDGATTAFADQFGTTASDLKEQSIARPRRRSPATSRRRSTGCAKASSTTAPTSCGPTVERARRWCSTARSSASSDATPCCVRLRRARASPTSRPPERTVPSRVLSAR